MKKPIAVIVASLMIFAGCRKGADDPALSLRTRKDRLAGEWRMTEGRAVINFRTPHETYNESYSFDGKKMTINTTESGGPVIYTGAYALSLTTNKDGSFGFSEIVTNKALNGKGKWNFNAGVGESKKKECVIFTIAEVSGSHTQGFHLFNRTGTEFLYSIVELRNKKLVVHSQGRTYLDDAGGYIDFSTDYTFIQ